MPVEKSEYLSSVWRDGLFDGKVVFCTGGNGTIGSAQVRALVHLGADACIVGRNVTKTEEMAKDIMTARPGSKVLGIGAVDVRNLDSLQAAVDRCVSELGGIDFLIAGAAGNFLAPMSQLSANAFKTVIDIDLIGSYNATKVCIPHLLNSVKKHNSRGGLPKERGHGPSGRIIYVSATLHYAGTPFQTHAAVAKAGVDALSNNVSIEYGPLGLTSNIIAPGPIAGTEGMDRLSGPRTDDEDPWKYIPLGRWGLVKEIADATVWLFSDAANYVTGQVTVVDGGAWRTQSTSGAASVYPDFFVSGIEFPRIGSSEKSPKHKL
ncbi:putative peroxisomal 2,4-dienoyl-CoA reductase SPS19 [Xylariales sp. PMI_506]|nr:putative peroxisomal 2,4-dienoyl-CoA reductase SPS19 [Xylariales sp. PMI_506]